MKSGSKISANATQERSASKRDAQSGKFLGRANDGTLIARPVGKPDGFTIRQLQKVIKEVREKAPA
jgi:hypothetical protein